MQCPTHRVTLRRPVCFVLMLYVQLLSCIVVIIRASPSAEVLPPRTCADTRGIRPVPPGSAGLPPTQFSGGLRRTSGERPANVRRTLPEFARICVDSAANWRSCLLRKCPPGGGGGGGVNDYFWGLGELRQ